MKKTVYTLLSIATIVIMSCGQNAEQKAAQEKAKMDSVAEATKNQILKEQEKQKENKISNKTDELQEQITKAQAELLALQNDQQYDYFKTRLATVRARVSTGAGYGWIDKDGKFWEGKDADKAFDNAAEYEKNQLAKIEAKNTEIKSMQDRLKDLQDLQKK